MPDAPDDAADLDRRRGLMTMPNFMGMMKQAAQLQSKMQEMQAELDRSRSRAPPAAAWSR